MAWYDKYNEGGSVNTKARNTAGKWYDRLNTQVSEEEKKKPKPPVKPAVAVVVGGKPIGVPAVPREEILRAGKPLIFTGPDFSGEDVIAPKLNMQGKFGFVGRVAEKIVNVPLAALTDATNRVSDLFDVEDIPGSAARKLKADTPVERIAGIAKVGTGAIGLIPTWLAISTGIEAGKELPGPFALPAKALSYGFKKLAEAGSFVGDKIVDVLPISEKSKGILRQPIEEIAAITAQVGSAKVISIGIKKYVPVVKEKVKARQKQDVNISTDMAKQIVNETVKEVPLPQQRATVSIPTQNGPVKVVTNQKLVLQNFIKDREDINYKQVKTLGNDINGNQIQARFEWDYKKQQATIYTTNKTTASNLAHELGHYFDRKLSGVANERLSDLFPDYAKNKSQIDSALTAYVLDRANGSLSAKEISAKIKKSLIVT